MRRNNRFMLAVGAAAIAMMGPYAMADWYSASYEADTVPTDPSNNPTWNKVLDSGDIGTTSFSANNGILTVMTGATTDYIEFRTDGGGGQAWNPTGAGSTLELRLKTDYNVEGADWAGGFGVFTGNRGWLFRIGAHYISDAIGGGDFNFTTNDAFHTLRFTIADEVNGPISLYTDNGQLPAKTWAGGPTGANRLAFGDLTTTADGGQIQWDYIRWTNAGALVPVPPEPTWVVDASGNWNTALNWGGQVPNGVGSIANLTTVINAPRTIYSDTAITVGTLRFNNANRYNIGGNGELTIETASGNGLIDVQAGDHKINLPLIFASSTDVNVAAGAALTIADPATINAAKTVTTNGTVLIQAPLTIQAGGALVVGGGAASLFGAPSLEAGAKVDLKTNDLAIDYRGLAGQADAVKAQLASGYNSGAWNGDGINTSSAVQGETGLGWMDDAANQQVLIKYTYQGDATLDGKVDVGDLGALASNWQLAANWSGGDFDYSGTVNVGDLGILATNWQKGSSNPLGPSFSEALAALGLPGVSVPEPASLGLIALAMGAMQLRRRNR